MYLGLQKALAKQHWPSVAMNCRGATEPNRATRAYHAGASVDVRGVFEYLVDSQAATYYYCWLLLGWQYDAQNTR
jgi:predicted alpha/beta-fold hydrolase